MLRASPMVIVVLLWFAGLGAAAQFGKVSILFPQLSAIYAGHSEAALGLVVSIVGIVGILFGTTAGLIVSRIGVKTTLLASLLAGAGVSALQSTLPGYEVMILSRVIEGFSHLGIVVVAPTLIAALAPAERRPLAMTLWSSFFGVTYAVLALLLPLLPAQGGAPVLFLGHALWMLVLALLLVLALPGERPAGQTGRHGLLAEHLAIYSSPRLAAPAMGFCCYTFLYVACLTLLPPASPEDFRSVMATGMPLVSIAVSLTLGVRLLHRMPAVRLVQWGFAAAMPGFVLLWLGWGQGWGMVAGAFWLSAALGIVQGASFAAIPELNEAPEDRARAAGAIAQLGNVGTTAGTPLLALLLVQGGAGALCLVALACLAAGIVIHRVQARRRQTRST